MNVAEFLQNWSGTISGIGSLILSFALVYFYKIQTNIQNTQTEIQKDQKHWMEVNHQPRLNIYDIEVENIDGIDFVDFSCENIGNGPALNMRCFYKAYPSPTDFPLIYGIQSGVSIDMIPDIRKNIPDPHPDLQYTAAGLSPTLTPLTSSKQPSYDIGCAIPVGDRLHIEGYLGYEEYRNYDHLLNTKIISINELDEFLQETRATQYKYGIFVRYEDIGGNVYDELIDSGGIRLNDADEEPEEMNVNFPPSSFKDPQLNNESQSERMAINKILSTRSELKEKLQWIQYIYQFRESLKLPHDLYTYYRIRKKLR